VGRCAAAGLLLAWAAVTRGNGAAAMVAVVAVLLAGRAGWRPVTATTAAFAFPVLTYMMVFDLTYGNFALTNSDGMFAWSLPPLLAAREPAAYLWSPGAWWRHDADPGINAHNNALAARFALAAIRAQPAAYLRTVASGVMLTFLAPARPGPTPPPHPPEIPRAWRT
jgi:hypothetical protein